MRLYGRSEGVIDLTFGLGAGLEGGSKMNANVSGSYESVPAAQVCDEAEGVARCRACRNRMGLRGVSLAVSPWCDTCRRERGRGLGGPAFVLEAQGETTVWCVSCHGRFNRDDAYFFHGEALCGHCRVVLFG